jgi:uncharacterized protein (DUF433 family)
VTAQESLPATTDLRKYIETRFYGERPHIRGRRLLVSMLVANFEGNGWTVAETARNFGIAESEVLAALLYYHEHKAEIDSQDAEEQRQFDEMYRLHGSK